MVYDDDKGPAQFNDISDDDLRRRREARDPEPSNISEAVRRHVNAVAQKNPSWDEERIHAALRRARLDIPKAVVYRVVAEMRGAGSSR